MTTEQQGATPEPAAPEAVVAQPQGTTEAAPTGPEASAEESAELAKTNAWVEGIRQKANRATVEANAEARGDEESDDEGGSGEPAAAATGGEEAKPEAKAEGEEGEKKPRRALADLHADHRARLAEKKSEKLQARLDAVVAVLQGLQAPADTAATPEGAEAPAKTTAAPEVTPKAEDDPEPDFDLEPKDWHAWRERQFERRWAAREESLQQRLLEQLNPLIEGGKLQKEQVQQQAQVQAEQQRSAAIAREVASLVDEYKETNEGQGYGARVDAYARYFVGDLIARGATEEQARAAFQAEALDLLLRGENEGHHPVAYYDAYLIHKARLAQGLPGTIQPAATAEAVPATPAPAKPEPAPAKPQKTPQQRRAETDLAAAAAAAKLPEASAGGDRDAVSAGPQEFDIGKMVQRGKVTGEMMERIAAAQGRPLMKVIREGMRAATGG